MWNRCGTGATALSFKISLHTEKCCYFIASVSLDGEGTFCLHGS